MPESTASPAQSSESWAPDPEDGRIRHYGEFYGLDPAFWAGADPRDALDSDDRPVLVVVGNCKAEALRILLDGPVRGVRIPPVHELTAHDVPLLQALLARTDVLVVQPIHADYRGLPVGTEQCIARLRPGVRVVRVPSLYFTGLHPWQVTVRHPSAPADPAGVPYHDLRTLLRAHDGRVRRLDAPAVAYRELAAASRAELERRERQGGTVVVSDLLDALETSDFATINHPGNRLLTGLAQRVRAELDVDPTVPDPGRILLRSVFAPVYPQIVEALGAAGEPRAGWLVGGEPVDEAEIVEQQLAWYAEYPQVVEAGLVRHAATIAALGWA